MKLHYFQSKNFGDALSPVLVERLSGERAVYSPMPTAEMVAVGSVLFGGSSLFLDRRNLWSAKGLAKLGQRALDGLRAPLKIWGSGFLTDTGVSHAIRVRNFKVLALRGRRSLEILTRLGFVSEPSRVALGDPGLLFPLLLKDRPETQYDVGVVPHFLDREQGERLANLLSEKGVRVKLIDVMQDDPLATVREIGECERIVSSSLHGLIAADAFGLPRVHVLFSSLGQRADEVLFKFQDYGSALGEGEWRVLAGDDVLRNPQQALTQASKASDAAVRDAAARLKDCFPKS